MTIPFAQLSFPEIYEQALVGPLSHAGFHDVRPEMLSRTVRFEDGRYSSD